MYLLGIAVLLTLLKLADVEPVASWSWYVILGSYGVTVAWWAWADMSGYTKRRAADKIEQRRLKRIEKNKEAMGTSTRSRSRR